MNTDNLRGRFELAEHLANDWISGSDDDRMALLREAAFLPLQDADLPFMVAARLAAARGRSYATAYLDGVASIIKSHHAKVNRAAQAKARRRAMADARDSVGQVRGRDSSGRVIWE